MKVLVATKEHAVFDAIAQAQNIECVSALDTGRIYAAIPECQLAIIDYADLIAHPFSVGLIRNLLESSALTVCSSEELVASPGTYLEARALRRRALPLPPKRTIAFTSYSGGTGKTSLALDTAVHFVRRTRAALALPAAVIEFTYGSSAFQALLGDEQHSLYELISRPQDVQPSEVNGVSLFPMDYDQVRMLPTHQVADYLQHQATNHVLTVIDAMWPHGLTATIDARVDLWIIVATPRVDAVDNAQRLREELVRDYGEERVIVAINQGGGLGNSLALMGTPREIELPQVQRSEVIFGGRLGKQILSHIYGPLWQEYERLGSRKFRLFRRS